MNLSPTLSRFVLHWGEMGTRWGVNRTVAQIHALLFITGRPMHAEEIADTLDVARSNVSNSLRELQGWNLIKLTHLAGDRRDHFETSTQVWELLRTVVRERQRREIAPTIEVLNELLADPALSRDPAEARLRIRETQELLVTLTAWSDEMLKLDTDTLTKVLKLGAKIKKLLGRDSAAATDEVNPVQLLGP
ncbi:MULTISPECIES: GbsR/MarR family transcriptional regulator [unclassified Rhizobacter]|uniref:GbsR/MarR family transcriptional regulator n=1 Tax=unclassified Rhizobacter TaxID=2640088 RepID=UPI0006FBC10E|nr:MULTISPECIES: MarR family transcriptional regulator [unclassified Rhizobacter]KQU73495.1 MarR family transcriptional regulator [Rhizobacter sp. Root29]KQV98680.1 MarR family transcriptional regulator [Rhizobacter sp. Root1238]KRB04933.1 MarR family transcriptional regulator [Rhizobacter sp. Root16D2]